MRRLRRTDVGVALAAAIGLLATGCGDDPDFDHIQFRQVSAPPGLASLRPNEIRLGEGIAVKARVTAVNVEGEAMDLLELETSDSTVFQVDRGPSYGTFVFWGIEAGTAELDVFTEGLYEASIPVKVEGED